MEHRRPTRRQVTPPEPELPLQQESLWIRIRYDEEFLELLCPKSSSGRLLFAFSARVLTAHHINHLHSEAHVINEAYVRGAILIQKGGEIRDLFPWMKQTVHNIVRELSREHQRTVSFEDYHEQPTLAIAETIQDNLKTLRFALQMLDPRDQYLLNLKIAQGQSWRAIREAFNQAGLGDISEQTLRKRKERALIRLRKQYHAIDPASENPQ